VSKTPILPLSIISTSFPGIALMDYKKKGEEELDLVKDDALRVFKRYNHWSYVRYLFFRSSDTYGRCLLGCQGGRRRPRLGTCTSLDFSVQSGSFDIVCLVLVHWQSSYRASDAQYSCASTTYILDHGRHKPGASITYVLCVPGCPVVTLCSGKLTSLRL
jgi:hypothetical protein